MTEPSVDPTEKRSYQAVAAELRRIAAALEKLPGAPGGMSIDIQPGKAELPTTIAAVDAVAEAVLGKKAETRPMSNGKYYHHADHWGPIRIAIYQAVTGPPDEREIELQRLRAEVYALRAAKGASDG